MNKKEKLVSSTKIAVKSVILKLQLKKNIILSVNENNKIIGKQYGHKHDIGV